MSRSFTVHAPKGTNLAMMTKHILMSAVLAVALWGAAGPGLAQVPQCLDDQQVQQAVQNQQILPYSDVLARAGIRPDEALKFRVCMGELGWDYHIEVLKGQIARTVIVPAT